jgi:hypothetical protein
VLARSVRVRRPLGSSSRRRSQAKLLAVFAALIGLPLALFHERVVRCCILSDSDFTNIMLKEYVEEAYPLWRRKHPEQCPDSLADLNEYTNRGRTKAGSPDTNDIWGHPMWMTCASGRIVVRSAGQDGVFATDDDLQDMSAASAATRSTE